MFLVLVELVAVEREHDGLQQVVDLSYLNKRCERGNVSRIGLEKVKELAIVLMPVQVSTATRAHMTRTSYKHYH